MEQMLPPEIDQTFRGMVANSRADFGPGFLTYIQNFTVKDGELAGRRGLDQIGSTLPAKIQGVHQWEMLNGTAYTCVFANGDLYVYSWTGNTFTLYDLSAAGLTVSSTADINCATSRGRLIFTDGVNKPVMVVGPVGSIAYTTLTNAPVAHRVGIYYDKVFFWDIPGYENEFQWSDEGDPVNGYSGDDQAWEFAQTDAGRILGAAPLNERLVILKEDSATVLMGNADENFQTLAVREGLSETEGTVAGGSVVIYQGDVFCLSTQGPRRIRMGQVYESIHDVGGVDYLRDIISNWTTASLANSLSFVDRDEGHVGFLVPYAGSSDVNVAMVWHQEIGAWTLFKFSGLNFTAVNYVEDNTGKSWVLFGDDNGKVYKYRSDWPVYDDEGTAIELHLKSRLMGGQQSHIEKRLIEVQLQFYVDTDFEGEIRPYLDGEEYTGKRFGVFDFTGKKRYRRGFNGTAFRPGWSLYANRTAQTITLEKASAFMSAIGMYGDWDGDGSIS